MNIYKFSIKTLGCKVNQYEEQVLRENLLRFGFEEEAAENADLIIINSCTVTEQADIKTKKIIRRIKKDNPSSKIFLTGCYAVVEEDIESLATMPEIYKVVHNKDKHELPLIIDSIFYGNGNEKYISNKVTGFSDHTRAFLKLQDGCDQKCSYCKVNLVRGPSRCKGRKLIIEELKGLLDNGYREIVLTGICLGSWRGENGEGLSDLLREIETIDREFRLRLSSIEPNQIDSSLITFMASSQKVCKHLHIPLQSGSDKILKAMNRRYDTRVFRALVSQIRREMPLVGISMDVIAGFPGEDEADFQETMDFVSEIKPSRLHVFKYSDRKGTVAFEMPDKVPSSIAKNRVERLIEMGDKLMDDFYKAFIDKEIEVLIEFKSDGESGEGYTGEYVRTKLKGFKGAKGEIVKIKADLCNFA